MQQVELVLKFIRNIAWSMLLVGLSGILLGVLIMLYPDLLGILVGIFLIGTGVIGVILSAKFFGHSKIKFKI